MIRELKTSLARKAAVATVAAAAMFGSAQANAGVIQLGFILDSSGSIGASNWTTITSGLSSAISSLVPTTSSYEVSVVTFSNTASTIVNHVLIDSIATRSAVAAAISAAPFLASTTAMDLGFSAMQTALGGSTLVIDSTYVNLATDGVPDNQTAATNARNALIAAGTDNISIEAIGAGVNAAYLQGSICYPLACDTTSPYNFPSQGFYIAVANATEYADAIQNKIKVVTNQVPEPEMLVVFAIGLIGLGIMRRHAA